MQVKISNKSRFAEQGKRKLAERTCNSQQPQRPWILAPALCKIPIRPARVEYTVHSRFGKDRWRVKSIVTCTSSTSCFSWLDDVQLFDVPSVQSVDPTLFLSKYCKICHTCSSKQKVINCSLNMGICHA